MLKEQSTDGSQQESEACWVCLDSGPGLIQPCRCPRFAHPECLARWQLQSAGKEEERFCRFCSSSLPDWKPILTPAGLKPSIPVVSVHYNGVCHRLRVKPGPEGYEQFRRQLHKLTGMSMLDSMHITFQCKAPGTAQDLNFKGLTAFDAAIHCAAVAAAERATKHPPKGKKPAKTTTSSSSSSSSSSYIDTGASSDTDNIDSMSSSPSSSSSGFMQCLRACLHGRTKSISSPGSDLTPTTSPSPPAQHSASSPAAATSAGTSPTSSRSQQSDSTNDTSPLLPGARSAIHLTSSPFSGTDSSHCTPTSHPSPSREHANQQPHPRAPATSTANGLAAPPTQRADPQGSTELEANAGGSVGAVADAAEGVGVGISGLQPSAPCLSGHTRTPHTFLQDSWDRHALHHHGPGHTLPGGADVHHGAPLHPPLMHPDWARSCEGPLSAARGRGLGTATKMRAFLRRMMAAGEA